MPNLHDIEVKIDRADLLFFRRVLDTALSELVAAVADGDVDESVTIELDEALATIEEYLK